MELPDLVSGDNPSPFPREFRRRSLGKGKNRDVSKSERKNKLYMG
jgi:hypothetical protein